MQLEASEEVTDTVEEKQEESPEDESKTGKLIS